MKEMKWQTPVRRSRVESVVCGRWDGCSRERSERIESDGASGMYRMRQSMDDGSGGELGEAR